MSIKNACLSIVFKGWRRWRRWGKEWWRPFSLMIAMAKLAHPDNDRRLFFVFLSFSSSSVTQTSLKWPPANPTSLRIKFVIAHLRREATSPVINSPSTYYVTYLRHMFRDRAVTFRTRILTDTDLIATDYESEKRLSILAPLRTRLLLGNVRPNITKCKIKGLTQERS